MASSSFKEDAPRGDAFAQFIYEHVFLGDLHLDSGEVRLVGFSGDDRAEQFKGCDILVSRRDRAPYRVDVKSAVDWAGKNEKTGKPLQTFAQEVSYLNREGEVVLGWLTDSGKETDCYAFCWITEVNPRVAKRSNGYSRVESVADVSELEIALVSAKSLKNLIMRQCQSQDQSIRSFEDASRWLLEASAMHRAHDLHAPEHAGRFKLNLTSRASAAEEPFNVLAGKRDLCDVSSYHYVAKLVQNNAGSRWKLTCKKRPARFDANSDLRYLSSRGVTRFIHFTPSENLESILQSGLLPRSLMDAKNIGYACTDSMRLEGRQFVNLSVTNPNIKMFWAKRKDRPRTTFAVLALRPELLREAGAYSFRTTNAASKNAQPCSVSELFSGDRPRYFDRSWPTDNQAEVLVESAIPARFIESIQLPSRSKQDPDVARLADGLCKTISRLGLECTVSFNDTLFDYNEQAIARLDPNASYRYYFRSWDAEDAGAAAIEDAVAAIEHEKAFDSWARSAQALRSPSAKDARDAIGGKTWSLRYIAPKDTHPLSLSELSALAVIERIVNRGRLTAVSPWLESRCSSALDIDLAHRMQCALVELCRAQALERGCHIHVRVDGISAGHCGRLANDAVSDLCLLSRHVSRLYGCESLFDGISAERGDEALELLFTDKTTPASRSRAVASLSGTKTDISFELTRISEPAPIVADEEPLAFILGYVFGFNGFREGQLTAIRRGLRRRDTIVLLPTGSGKSAVFQMLSLVIPGMSFVVSPIISLIEDQILNLKARGIDRVACITSTLTPAEKDGVLARIGKGQLLMCYVAPERFQSEKFNQAVERYADTNLVSVIAIDEAHCVSEWGHDFRTAYLGLAQTCRRVCRTKDVIPPIIALTGTASSSVLTDIRGDLDIDAEDEACIIQPRSFDRPEIKFRVIRTPSGEKAKALEQLIRKDIPEDLGTAFKDAYAPKGDDTNSGVIFCVNVNGSFGLMASDSQLQHGHPGVVDVLKKVIPDSVCTYAGSAPKMLNLSARAWSETKRENAALFKENKVAVMVATKAFGMGIDKPNVRWVVHYGMPSSLEAYYQEVGRAARDGKTSFAYLLLSDDYPEVNSDLLNPAKTPVSEVRADDEAAKGRWAGDDISRILYFHASTFSGADAETELAKRVLSACGRENFAGGRWQLISPEKDGDAYERAIYRFCILGVFEGYTVEYSPSKLFVVTPSPFGGEALRDRIVECYMAYVRAYNPDDTYLKKARADLLQAISNSADDRDYILRAVRHLLVNFTYKVLEEGRRRATWTILEAARKAADAVDADKTLRDQILAYLTLDVSRRGGLQPILHDASNSSALIEIVRQNASSGEWSALLGKTSRMLEDYPQHFGMHLLQSVARARTGDRAGSASSLEAACSFASSSYGIGGEPMARRFMDCLNASGADELSAEDLDAAVNACAAATEQSRGFLLGLLKSKRANEIKLIDAMHEIALIAKGGLS